MKVEREHKMTYTLGQEDVEDAILEYVWKKSGMNFDARMQLKGKEFDIKWSKGDLDSLTCPIELTYKGK